MKRITELTTINYNKINLNEELNKSLEDEQFQNLISKLDVNKDVMKKYITKLQRSALELNNCQKCVNLCECKNEMNGYVYFPMALDNSINFSFKPCKYKKEADQLNNYRNYITLYNMPSSLLQASFKNIWTDNKARIPVIKYLTNFITNYLKHEECKGLYLSGNFGSGKTYLIAAMLNELASKNIKVGMVYFPEFLRTLKGSFEEGTYNENFNYIKKVPVLLIDDIGAETTSTWSRDEILGSILQYRMDEKLPTFLTSNLTVEQLEQHLSITKVGVDQIKARRIIERVKFITEELSLISINNRQKKEEK